MGDLSKAIRTPIDCTEAATGKQNSSFPLPKWLVWGVAVASVCLFVDQFKKADTRGTFKKVENSYVFTPNKETRETWIAAFDDQLGEFVPGHKNFISGNGDPPLRLNNSLLKGTTVEELKETAVLSAKNDIYLQWLNSYNYSYEAGIKLRKKQDRPVFDF